MDEADMTGDLEVIDLEAEVAARQAAAGGARTSGRRRGRSRPATTTPPLEPVDTGGGWLRWTVLTLLVVVVVLGGWGALAYQRLSGVRDDLLGARADLVAARDALVEGELAVADEAFARASGTLSGVPDRVGGPVVVPVRLVPTYRRTLDAVADLAVAADVIAVAGGEITGVLDASGEGLGVLTPQDGRIPLEALQALAPVLADAAEDFRRAEDIVMGVPTSGVDAQVDEARVEFLELIGPAAEQVETASDITAVLPAMLGAEGPRTYLVAASNPTEARGSGGYLGAFTVLEAEDGQLSFAETRQIQELPILPRGEIPWPDDSLEARYDAYGGTGFMQNINMTPDFPSAAQAIERYWEAAFDTTLDGVMSLDPYAFESLLRIAGPIQVDGFGEVTADDVVDFVTYSAYGAITDPEERKRVIGQVATAAFQGFLSNPGDTSAAVVLDALGDMVSRDALEVHAARSDEQAVLVAAGVAGELLPEGTQDMVGVFLNSGAPYKVDYWLRRTIHYDVQLGPDGLSSATLLTGFENTAPTSGEVDYMIGQGVEPLDVGDVLTYVSTYCPPGCTFYEIPDDGFEGLESQGGTELGLGVTSTWMRLPAGQARQLAWSYSTPGAWTSRGRDRVYRLHYAHQPTILGVELSVEVDVPAGHEPVALPEGATVADGVVTYESLATRSADLEFIFSPVAGP